MNKFILIIILIAKFAPCSYSQTSEVNGIVFNQFESGIPFAVVVNKSTSKGALCDSLGRFKIRAKIGDTLSGSSVGYYTKNYVLKSLSDLFNFVLLTKADTLKEVSIVTIRNNLNQRVGIQKGTRISKNSYFLPTDSFLHAVCFNSQDVKFKKISTLNIKMGYTGNSKFLPVRINLYTQSNEGVLTAKYWTPTVS